MIICRYYKIDTFGEQSFFIGLSGSHNLVDCQNCAIVKKDSDMRIDSTCEVDPFFPTVFKLAIEYMRGNVCLSMFDAEDDFISKNQASYASFMY